MLFEKGVLGRAAATIVDASLQGILGRIDEAEARCSGSSNSAANGRSNRCTKTAPLRRSRSPEPRRAQAGQAPRMVKPFGIANAADVVRAYLSRREPGDAGRPLRP